MNDNIELVLRALSAFYDGEYANVTLQSISDACKEDAFRNAIKVLKTLNVIEDKSTNGYAQRFKLNTVLDCPDFIFNSTFMFNTKIYLLRRWKAWNTTNTIFNNSKQDAYLLAMNLNTQDVVENTVCIKKKIFVPEGMELIKDEFGYKLRNIPIDRSIIGHCCNICGETDPSKFHKGNYTRCKKCCEIIDRSKISNAERLYKSSKQNANHNNYEHDLDVEYIQQLLDKQHNKCCYSGLTFGNDKKDRLTYPTIDRIDSTKGYIKGNICICTWIVNSMKNNLTTEQFKDIITKIYNNLDNF